jgi:hypothetical protein
MTETHQFQPTQAVISQFRKILPVGQGVQADASVNPTG